MSVTHIGRCKGCDKSAKLDDGVCQGCLDDPRRGRKWAEMSYKCRTNPEFALDVFLQILLEAGRQKFVAAYGEPPGVDRCRKDPAFAEEHFVRISESIEDPARREMFQKSFISQFGQVFKPQVRLVQ